MNAATKERDWTKFIKFYLEQNAGKPTRLGVFERDGAIVTDYWIESGLPLTEIDIEMCQARPSVQITVGSYTQEVKNVSSLAFRFSLAGDEDGIDLCSADGRTTLLRFERETIKN